MPRGRTSSSSGKTCSTTRTRGRSDGEVIGIPKILNMHELLPFWRSFLTELGFSVVLSDSTNKKIIKEGVENIIVESCFPIKLAHGHILNMMDKGIKRLFMPSIISLRKQSEGVLNSFACPYAQSLPYTSRASIDFEKRWRKGGFSRRLFRQGAEGGPRQPDGVRENPREIEEGGRGCLFRWPTRCRTGFTGQCLDEGSDFLGSLKPGEKVMVLVGRPYNSMDPGASLNVHKKLSDLGIASIPIDMLPLDGWRRTKT